MLYLFPVGCYCKNTFAERYWKPPKGGFLFKEFSLSAATTTYPIQKNGFYAIFVDVGYLFAQGSEVVFNKKIERNLLEIDIDLCLLSLRRQFPFRLKINLLRTYWYDGIKGNMLSPEQQCIARADLVKFRAGTVNSANIQKGVDSLIVTDLIELARNKAITDALIVTGDGDLKIGMTIAQSFGVRVHLLGMGEQKPSQSMSLLDEADTLRALSKDDITLFLKQKPDEIGKIAENYIKILSLENIHTILSYIEKPENKGKLPEDSDGRLLRFANHTIGRELNNEEKKLLRSRFLRASKVRVSHD